MSVHPDDLPPLWGEATSSSAANLALAFLIVWVTFIFALVSPAVIIATWRWLL